MLVAATVHFPYMTAWPERASPEHRAATAAGFALLGRAFAQASTQTLLVFTSEHIVNLEPRMAPPFVLGSGARHAAFPEPQFNLAPLTWRGDPALAAELLAGLYAQGFDPAHSSELRLDHGTTLPLAQLQLPQDMAVVPVIINSIFPPLPTLSRCRQLGSAIAQTLGRSTLGRRVGILATGGLSHVVGAPGMERNDPDFDAAFVQAIAAGDLDTACSVPDSQLDAAGNGTHEIRNWVAAAAAAQPRKPRIVTSIPFAPGWNTGVHQLLWEESA
jgi:aromatic ring-opening dioxygenase catalytic subunit (LigB family)